MTKNDGPLTERQEDILDYLSEGLRHKQIASRMELGHSTVKQEIMGITRKMRVNTSQEAVAKWVTAIAYRNASVCVLSARIPHPGGDVDEHVNHVLEGIADHLRRWCEIRMPK